MDFEIAINCVISHNSKEIIRNPRWKRSVKAWLRCFTDEEYKEIDPHQPDPEQPAVPDHTGGIQQQGPSSQPCQESVAIQSQSNYTSSVSSGCSSTNDTQQRLRGPADKNQARGQKRKRHDIRKANVEQAMKSVARDTQHEEILADLGRVVDRSSLQLPTVSCQAPKEDSHHLILPFSKEFSMDWMNAGQTAHEAACLRRVLILCMAHRVEYTENELRKEKRGPWGSKIRTQIYLTLSKETRESTERISNLISAAKRYMHIAKNSGPSHLLEIQPEKSHLWESKLSYNDINNACDLLYAEIHTSTVREREERSLWDFRCVEYVIKKLRRFGESFSHLTEAKTTLTETLSKFVDFESLRHGTIKQKKMDFYGEKRMSKGSEVNNDPLYSDSQSQLRDNSTREATQSGPTQVHQTSSNPGDLSDERLSLDMLAAAAHQYSVDGSVHQRTPVTETMPSLDTCCNVRMGSYDQSQIFSNGTENLIANDHEHSNSLQTEPGASLSQEAVRNSLWEQIALQPMGASSDHQFNARHSGFDTGVRASIMNDALISSDVPARDGVSSVLGDGQDMDLFHDLDPFEYIDSSYFTLNLGG